MNLEKLWFISCGGLLLMGLAVNGYSLDVDFGDPELVPPTVESGKVVGHFSVPDTSISIQIRAGDPKELYSAGPVQDAHISWINSVLKAIPPEHLKGIDFIQATGNFGRRNLRDYLNPRGIYFLLHKEDDAFTKRLIAYDLYAGTGRVLFSRLTKDVKKDLLATVEDTAPGLIREDYHTDAERQSILFGEGYAKFATQDSLSLIATPEENRVLALSEPLEKALAWAALFFNPEKKRFEIPTFKNDTPELLTLDFSRDGFYGQVGKGSSFTIGKYRYLLVSGAIYAVEVEGRVLHLDHEIGIPKILRDYLFHATSPWANEGAKAPEEVNSFIVPNAPVGMPVMKKKTVFFISPLEPSKTYRPLLGQKKTASPIDSRDVHDVIIHEQP